MRCCRRHARGPCVSRNPAAPLAPAGGARRRKKHTSRRHSLPFAKAHDSRCRGHLHPSAHAARGFRGRPPPNVSRNPAGPLAQAGRHATGQNNAAAGGVPLPPFAPAARIRSSAGASSVISAPRSAASAANSRAASSARTCTWLPRPAAGERGALGAAAAPALNVAPLAPARPAPADVVRHARRAQLNSPP